MIAITDNNLSIVTMVIPTIDNEKRHVMIILMIVYDKCVHFCGYNYNKICAALVHVNDEYIRRV